MRPHFQDATSVPTDLHAVERPVLSDDRLGQQSARRSNLIFQGYTQRHTQTVPKHQAAKPSMSKQRSSLLRAGPSSNYGSTSRRCVGESM